MKSTADLTAELTVCRSTHAGATRLAARVWTHIERLQASRIWLPRERALSHLAHAIYFNSGYDAFERFESDEELKEDMTPDVDKAWPMREMVAGVENYVLRPFFAKQADYLHDVGLSSIGGCSPDELAALKVAPRPRPACEAITGVSDDELAALVAMHRASTLKIVNTLRHLDSALSYPNWALGRLDRLRAQLPVVVEEGVEKLLADLAEMVVLPGLEKPMKGFSSDWEKKYKVYALEYDSELAVYLRDC